MRSMLLILFSLFASVTSAEVITVKPDSQNLMRAYNYIVGGQDWVHMLDRTMSSLMTDKPYKDLIFTECHQENAFFEPASGAIVFCYELLTRLFDNAARIAAGDTQKLQTLGGGATLYILFHEYGHALIRSAKTPVLGREEDAADQIAAMLIRKTPVKNRILSSLMLVSLPRGNDFETVSRASMADEHSLTTQRRANLICWIGGDDDEYLKTAVRSGELTEHRATRCASELRQAEKAVNSLLQ